MFDFLISQSVFKSKKTFGAKMTAWVWQKEWYQNLDMCTPICRDISQKVSVKSLLCQPVQLTFPHSSKVPNQIPIFLFLPYMLAIKIKVKYLQGGAVTQLGDHMSIH